MRSIVEESLNHLDALIVVKAASLYVGIMMITPNRWRLDGSVIDATGYCTEIPS